jgi:hypothetical protein
MYATALKKNVSVRRVQRYKETEMLYQSMKIIVDGTVYGFRVPKGSSLDANDVIKTGRVAYIRESIRPATDVFGKLIGRTGWNVVKNSYTVPKAAITPVLLTAIKTAIERTKTQIAAEEETGESLLPRLISSTYKGELIQRDSKCYFINSIAWCPVCRERVHGTQELTVNPAGKVTAVGAFKGDDKATNVKGRKWLHIKCLPQTVPIPESQFVEVTEEVTVEYGLTRAQVLDILNNPQYTDGFARGVAWAFLMGDIHGA